MRFKQAQVVDQLERQGEQHTNALSSLLVRDALIHFVSKGILAFSKSIVPMTVRPDELLENDRGAIGVKNCAGLARTYVIGYSFLVRDANPDSSLRL